MARLTFTETNLAALADRRSIPVLDGEFAQIAKNLIWKNWLSISHPCRLAFRVYLLDYRFLQRFRINLPHACAMCSRICVPSCSFGGGTTSLVLDRFQCHAVAAKRRGEAFAVRMPRERTQRFTSL